MALTQFLPMDSYYHGILAATDLICIQNNVNFMENLQRLSELSCDKMERQNVQIRSPVAAKFRGNNCPSAKIELGPFST